MKKGPVEFIFVIDKSAAMRGREDVVVIEFNAMLREQQDMEGEALITTVLFDDRYELFHDRIDIHAAAPLSKEDYKAQGKAALFDAIGKSMHKFRRVRHGTRESCREERAVFIIITGSGDRASRGYTEEMVRKRIAYRRKEYGWEFVFFGTSMDAAAMAGKIGIAAEMAQDCSADAEGIRTAYAAASSLLAAYRRDEGAGEPGSDMAVQAAKDLRTKCKDMVFTPADMIRNIYKQNEDSAIETLRRHLGNDIVITKWTEAQGEQELEEEELFEGEISASIFTIGCYTVRYAECLYADDSYGGAHGYHYHERVPAGKDIIAEYRDVKREKKRDEAAGIVRALLGPWMLFREKGVRIVEEVSVLCRSGNGADTDCWQNICLAAQSFTWSERIDYICTVKKSDTVPDGQAVLFVLSRYMGDSHTSESWYKFTPDGRVGAYRIGGYGQNDTDAWEL
nr:hypothetical protein [uncultured Acetatifactor sp.]